MQFDEFDKKAKKAADHHHPAYDEQAWNKMEKLLNTHMPQKEDDRRRFLFVLLVLFALGAAGLLIAKPWKNSKPISASGQTVQHQQPAAATPVAAPLEKINTVTKDLNQDGDVPLQLHQPGNLEVVTKLENKKNQAPILAPLIIKKENNQPAQPADKLTAGTNRNIKNDEPARVAAESLPNSKTNPLNGVVKNNTMSTGTVTTNPQQLIVKPEEKEPAKSTELTKQNPPIAQSKSKNEKTRTKKNNEFFFTLSAGPDISFLGKEKMGSTELVAGGGLGYTFNKRFTIRAGFYSGRKVYTASPDAYHPPTSFYSYYPYLEKVDANCKVVEIPLSVSYNFSRSSKQTFFGSAGISSYLMKKETYNYSYKYTPTGPTIKREWTIKNENEHYFSSLTLSAGYQRNISRHISLMVEPYVKLPLSGVGYGKVKLNSGGVLFSVGIKPFGAKKASPATH